MESQEITIPKKPRINLKPEIPYKRPFCVIPWRAVVDKGLTPHQLKTLAAIASFCNKAGITWVSLQRVGQDLGVTKQAVSKHYKILINLGYIRIINKGFRGIRGNTIQVIFDESLTVEDTIAKASIGVEEDLRAPYIIERQEREAMKAEKEISEAQARENLKRLAEMAKQVFKTPSEANKQIYKPVKGDTMTVRKMKESLSKTRVKPVDNFVDNSTKPVDNPVDKSVDNLSKDGLHRQPLGVDRRQKIYIDNVYKDSVNNNSVNNICLDKVLTLVLTLDDARARLTEDDIGMLERLVNAGVTEAELVQAIAEHKGKSTAAMCREMLLAR